MCAGTRQPLELNGRAHSAVAGIFARPQQLPLAIGGWRLQRFGQRVRFDFRAEIEDGQAIVIRIVKPAEYERLRPDDRPFDRGFVLA